MRVSRSRKSYDPSFREDPLALVLRSDRSLEKIADDLGIPASTLRSWYDATMAKKRTKPQPAPGLPVGDPAAEAPEDKIARLEKEVAALRRENDNLKVDRDILKKAATFFAKESE
jgi:transposase